MKRFRLQQIPTGPSVFQPVWRLFWKSRSGCVNGEVIVAPEYLYTTLKYVVNVSPVGAAGDTSTWIERVYILIPWCLDFFPSSFLFYFLFFTLYSVRSVVGWFFHLQQPPSVFLCCHPTIIVSIVPLSLCGRYSLLFSIFFSSSSPLLHFLSFYSPSTTLSWEMLFT